MGIVVGSGVIDVYVGWIGIVGVKVDFGDDELNVNVVYNDVFQVFI